MIRVLVAAHVLLYRQGLAEILARVDGLQIAGTHSGTPDELTTIAEAGPDVVILDMATPHSYAIARSVHQRAPSISLVALGVGDSESEMLRCAEAGITGYVTPDTSLDDLVAVIRSAARGEAICSAQQAGRLVRRLATLAGVGDAGPLQARLTSRERQIVALLEADLSNKEIAAELGIEVATVKNHVHNLLEKLGVHRRSEAARLVTRHSQSETAEAAADSSQLDRRGPDHRRVRAS
jgi:DNA-binding NarL/FixJ family response regulator